MQQLNNKATGSVLTAAEFNEPMSELQNVIEALGQVLTTSDLNQLGKAIAGYVANSQAYTDTGTANTYVLNVIGSKQGPPAYTNGMRVRFVAANANTGASTVNVAGLGVKSIKTFAGGALTANAINTTYAVTLEYDSVSGWFFIVPAIAYYELLPTETAANVVSREYYYDNILRWIPRSLHAGLRDGTNTTDIQPYIANAIADIKKGGATKKNAGRLLFPFMPAGYRIESTILINDNRGIELVFESVQTLSTDADIGTNCQLQWFGNSTTSVISLQTLAYATKIVNPSINCKASTNHALCGIQIGADTGSTAGRDITFENPYIEKGRFGIAVSFADNANVDAAPVKIFGGVIRDALDAGLHVGGGNVLVSTYSLYIENNGATPTTDAYNVGGKGANTLITSGQLHEYDRTATGTPVDGDVYQVNGAYGWWGGWSEVKGVMLTNINNTNVKPPILQSVRHYASEMTDTNTPTSVNIRSPGASVISCLFFGDVQLTSGLGGTPTLIGTQFYNGADLGTVRPTLGIGTFKGTGVDTYHMLLNIGNKGNQAQIAMGGGGTNNFVDKNYKSASIVVNDQALAEVRGPNTGDSGYSIGEVNATNGSFELMSNCYKSDSTHYKAFKIGYGTRIVVGPKSLEISTYNFADTTTAILYSSFTSNGKMLTTTNGYPIIQFPSISGTPTDSASAYPAGVYYNSSTNTLYFSNGTSWAAV